MNAIDDITVVDHHVPVPLDHDEPAQGEIVVFAREISATSARQRPWLLYLHGGPGHETTRPTWPPAESGWLARALREYRIILLDARGTGLSTPLDTPAPTSSIGSSTWSQALAERLTLYRADAIVRDAEHVRRTICGDQLWTVLGESAGGFALLTYLSIASHGVRAAMFAGGLPPLATPVEDVYRATHAGMIARSHAYYQRYPADRDRVARLHSYLAEHDIRLLSGDRLTGRRVQQLGILLGVTGGEERLHYLLERDPRSAAFAYDVAAATPWSGRDPLHTVLHESCWADGQITGWAAQRTLPVDYTSDPALFTGEHVYPWMLDHPTESGTDPGLGDGYHDLIPWRPVAERLAGHRWPRLYDADRLRSCVVPCAAIVYANDAYVPATLSQRTAQMIPTMRVWVDSQHRHDGLDVDGGHILDKLLAFVRDR